MNQPESNLQRKAKQSKRYLFIAEHRGGPLTKENHRALIKWARKCIEHVIHLADQPLDVRLVHALHVAREWQLGSCSTGEAMKASLGAHAAAREAKNVVTKAIARGIGQAVATAHAADHSLGGTYYALKATRLADLKVDQERKWQNIQLKKLPHALVETVVDMWERKDLDKRI